MKKSTIIAILMAGSIIFHIGIGIPLAEHESEIIGKEDRRDYRTNTTNPRVRL